MIYKDYKSSFQELLIKNNSLTIYHKNMQRLLTKTSEFSKSLMDYKTEAATRGVL